MSFNILISLTGFCIFLGSATLRAETIQVPTAEGRIQGSFDGYSYSFLGIPYAQAPIGKFRFMNTQPKKPWSGVLLANRPGAECMQKDGFTGLPKGSEDCLFLNVWSKRVPLPFLRPQPVMVFIHGGAFDNGSGMGPFNIYHGSKLSALTQNIVVTINYRLGALGGLASPALKAVGKNSGNNMFRDQIAALQWVQRNIRNFGGDPNNVTIFGESAGAMSVCMHMVSPASKGLFHKAIMESGSCQFKTLAEQEAADSLLIQKLGCQSSDSAAVLACLDKIPASQYVKNQATFGLAGLGQNMAQSLAYPPVVDGGILPKRPLELIAEGKFNRVPFIIGSNSFEIPGSPLVFPNIKTSQDVLRNLVGAKFSQTQAQSLFNIYAKERYSNLESFLGAIATDLRFSCKKDLTAELVAQQGGEIYTYLFDIGANSIHGAELPYVFQGNDTNLSKIMGKLWGTFAKTGKPTSEGVAWKTFHPSNHEQLLLGNQIVMTSFPQNEKCDFLEATGVGQD